MSRQLRPARRRLSSLLDELEDYAGAEEQLREELQYDAMDVEVRAELGLALMKQADFEAAEREFMVVLAMEPDHVATLDGFGDLLLIQGRLHEAAHRFRLVVELEPRHEASTKLEMMIRGESEVGPIVTPRGARHL
jgi:Flp pilus assembly protein TadD